MAAFLFASDGFAQSRVCDGVINDETVLQDIEILSGMSCIINDSTVKGFVVGDSPNTVLIYRSKVDNRIVISNASTVAISDVIVDDGNIEVVGSGIASVVDNTTNSGSILVNDNGIRLPTPDGPEPDEDTRSFIESRRVMGRVRAKGSDRTTWVPTPAALVPAPPRV